MAKMLNGENQAAEIWQIAAARLKDKVHPNTFRQWFANLVPVRVDDRTLILGVSDDFFGSWFKDYYSIDIADALQDIQGENYSFELEAGHFPPEPAPAGASAGDAAAETPREQSALPPSAAEAPRFADSSTASSAESASDRVRMIPRYTFENFVVGEENRYAYTAARRAAESPGIFNPLYIYGNTGTGKTHLLQAVAHEVTRTNPALKVRYATCEAILNSFVESLRSHSYTAFRAQLRDVDMLLVDDIHMLGRKSQLQEQFFNAFNVLYSENKQIILTSDKRPSEIEGLEARLISRFEQGVTQEIYPPGLEIRIAILRGMQQQFTIRFNDEILEFIASRISSNVRRLRGALVELLTRVSLDQDMELTLDRVEKILHRRFEEEHAVRQVTVEDIQRKVAEFYNLHLSDLLSEKRPKCIAEPRMIAMYLARKLTGYSFPQLGSAFGRNHATIMNACSKVPDLCRHNEETRRSVAMLERQLML